MKFEFSLFFWQLMVSALSIFFIISLIIGLNSKEKSFLFYANYTFFLLLYFIIATPYDFTWIDQLHSSSFRSIRWYSQVIYNCSYFIFFLSFLDVKQHLYKFYIFIIRVIASVFTIGTLIFAYAILTENPGLFDFFYIYIFVPVLFCFAIYALIKSCQLPGRLKYFFISGGIIFVSFGMIALFFPIMGWSFFNIDVFSLFYLGIFIEQFVFAFGLAYKVKLINTALLEKSLENQHIKENQNQLLAAKLKEQEEAILKLTAKTEKERISHLRSEFENQIHHLHLVSLQNQMNPHFIFNALNSIKVFLIENEKEKAIYYLNKFSKLIRHILDSTQLDSITLKEELTIIELYVNIENTRFEEEVKLSIYNPEKANLNTIMVPPMILHPFVENAIWHGLMLKEGEKNIAIHLSRNENKVTMTIRDNGIGRQKSKQHIGMKTFQKKQIGLEINQERLNHFNHKQNLNYTFQINDLKNKNNQAIGTEIEFIFNT